MLLHMLLILVVIDSMSIWLTLQRSIPRKFWQSIGKRMGCHLTEGRKPKQHLRETTNQFPRPTRRARKQYRRSRREPKSRQRKAVARLVKPKKRKNNPQRSPVFHVAIHIYVKQTMFSLWPPNAYTSLGQDIGKPKTMKTLDKYFIPKPIPKEPTYSYLCFVCALSGPMVHDDCNVRSCQRQWLLHCILAAG